MTRAPQPAAQTLVTPPCPYCGRDRRTGADACSHCDDLPTIDAVLHGVVMERVDG